MTFSGATTKSGLMQGFLTGATGLEPATSGVTGRRSYAALGCSRLQGDDVLQALRVVTLVTLVVRSGSLAFGRV